MATMIPPPSRDIFRAPSKTWILSFGLRAPVSNRIILTGGSRWLICIRWCLQILKRIYFYRTSKKNYNTLKSLTNSNKLKQMWKWSLFQIFLYYLVLSFHNLSVSYRRKALINSYKTLAFLALFLQSEAVLTDFSLANCFEHQQIISDDLSKEIFFRFCAQSSRSQQGTTMELGIEHKLSFPRLSIKGRKKWYF